MAGTIPGFSLAQMLDSDGTPLVGGKLYTIQAGTTSTPQTAYQDSGLTLPLSYPIICDAYGRLPQIFLADGSIKLRLTKSNGTQVFALDGVLVVGASSGGGGGSPVDATTILTTGDIKTRYGIGILSGFVRANGRTIGSVTSGATERANADAQSLFQYLWDTDANLSVSTGRGASSAADWAANKTISLPDWRGRTLAGLDDMGNSAAGVLTTAATGFGPASPIVLGNGSGTESRTLVQANLPAATLATTINDPGHFHDDFGPGTAKLFGSGGTGGTLLTVQFNNGDDGNMVTDTKTTGITASTALGGSSTAFPVLAPTRLLTIYIKL